MAILPPVEEELGLNENPVLYWNYVGLELNRLTHSVMGPQNGPPLSARALGILHLAIHDAFFAIQPGPDTYLTRQPGDKDPNFPDPNNPNPNPPDANAVAQFPLPKVGDADDATMAVAGAAITVLEAFYARRNTVPQFSFNTSEQLDQLLQKLVREYPLGNQQPLDALSESYRFGVDVGVAILKLLQIAPGEPGADQGSYRPKNGRYRFRDEPTHPVRLQPVDPNNPGGPQRVVHIYHAPFYGMTAKRFAVTTDNHVVADPPVSGTDGDQDANANADTDEYLLALQEVIQLGGAPLLNSTTRSPDQTVSAYYWAYDGSNLVGTPPRLYNQILRKIAWARKPAQAATDKANSADFARLFALANAALADAGIFCWREKYCHEFWRPLSGVREHDVSSGPAPTGGRVKLAPYANPFWLSLGAPSTNTNEISFKPPFPAYPSGHATFGAALFQMARLYYKDRQGLGFEIYAADEIGFDFVSDELNGINRDLGQPYDPNRPITDQQGTVRTRVVRHFDSLWAAIFDNAISRIYLGVHWGFDAFARADVTKADGTFKDPKDIQYTTSGPVQGQGAFPVGGVPLGIGIANDIFTGGLKPTPADVQPSRRKKCGPEGPTAPDVTSELQRQSTPPKSSLTNVR